LSSLSCLFFYLLFIFFFFYSSASPQDLPSFPTRRSSDLGFFGAGLEAFGFALPPLRTFAPGLPPGLAAVLQRGLSVEPARRFPTDRKSTRLNSSHLVISYAVFCLKKKKNNND